LTDDTADTDDIEEEEEGDAVVGLKGRSREDVECEEDTE
jgi:hypothetical protein